jgi:hypothetical protein
MNYKEREKIEAIAEFCGIIAVLIFKAIFWGIMAFIVFHFVAKFW